MEKRQAKDYIKEVLNQSFQSERFELFIRNLLNDIEQKDNSYSGNLIPEAFRDHIAHYKRIGKYTDPEGEELDILIVQTRSVKKLERTRTALRNFVVRHLKKFEKQYALAAFYSKEDDGAEWRFSLVKIDYETKKGKEGKIKVEEELVPAKRFSFLVGKYEDAHTAQKQLLPILTNDHANPFIVKEKDGDGSIEGAFSIQKVTDEFYEQYKELYLQLAENQSLTNALVEEGMDIERFVKKLLGQIVFLYFIQKKGWLGVPKDKMMGSGSKRFLQKRFEQAKGNDENYYDSFLRYLFYEALAREHNDEGVNYYFKKLACKIPFLNGGLFEADFDWEHANFTIPNDLFRNDKKNNSGDKGTGILDVFDRYNFTIKEDEPLEKEVAVDPEMLGKVFENMLEIKERKSKGAYYTPREIVHYMCQESLIHYLDNAVNDYSQSYQVLGDDQSSIFSGSTDKKGNLNLEIENKGDVRVPKDDLKILIRKGHLVLENEAIALDAKKRIEDGEIKSTKHKSILPDSISENAKKLDDALKNIKICDPAIGSGAFPVGLLHEIVNARQVLNSFINRDGYAPYDLKRHAIQECIYGVDIDASAIDIARLRLWLSMIVDEEDYDTINALPNLDFKIVCGNALIGLPGQGADRYPNLCDELEILKDSFFKESDDIKKKKLKLKINEKINEVLKAAEDFEGYDIDFDFKLYFSEVWRQKDGFDIVIGNPPYGLLNKKQNQNFSIRVNRAHYDYFKNEPFYESAKGGIINVFRLFVIKSGSILNDKTGVFSEIFPLAYTGDFTSKKLRKYTFDNYSVISIDAFPERDNENKRVFRHAKISVCILFLNKSKNFTQNFYLRIHDDKNIKLSNEGYLLSYNDIKAIDPINFTIPISTKEDLQILRKVYTGRGRISDYTNCYTGEIDLTLDSKYIRSNSSYSILLKGAIIGRYEIRAKMSQGEIEYLDADSYLKQNKGKRATHYLKSRIGMQGITGVNEKVRLKMTIIPKQTFLANSVNYIVMPNGEAQNKFVLAQLNSELHNYIFKLNSTNSNVNGYEVNNLPIIPSSQYQETICYLIDFILFIKQKNQNSKLSLLLSFFDNLVNAIVYELYFNEDFNDANKQIIPHLKNIKHISVDMSDEKKFTIIQSEFERLYDPNHPVRNNLETMDSIEEVRVIKETLKNN